MSQQIELDGSNLCIPEDAFEKFQAVSMYEETEFITLTNIVPTQTAESCVGDDTIMTSNDDAVVELSTDNEVYVNTKCDDGESRSPLKTDPATNNDHVNTTQPISGDLNEPKVTSNHGKKRGRKKKKTSEPSAIMNESHSECENILGNTNGPSESIEDIQNFIHSTDPAGAQKRRGRRPKSSNVSSDELSSSMKDLSKDSINDTKVVSLNKEPDSSSEKRLYRKRGRPSKSHENVITTMSSSNEDEVTIVDSTIQQLLSDNSDSSKKILKRRGRPRNISHEEKTDQIEILSTVDESKSSDILDSLPEAIFTTKLKKKGRPKKKTNMETVQSQNESQNENVSSHKASLEYDDDDISLSNLSKMNNLKTDLDGTIDNEDKIQLQDLLDSDYNTKLDDNEKHLSPIKKRGRPKKAHTESDTQALSKLELQKDNLDSRISDDDKDDGDDISLSQFKKTLHTNDEVAIVKDTSDTNIVEQDSQPISSQAQEESNLVKTDSEIQSSGKRNSKMPIMSDFEYNLDSIVNENNEIEIKDAQTDDAESLLVEDVSKRPIRKKVRQTLQYHEESDEDPFANVELSDDEPRRTRKGRRYNSDDEYFPGDVREPATPSSSDSESNEELDNDKTSRKRKCSKKLDSQSPRKKGRKPNSEKTVEAMKSSEIKTDYGLVNDIEDCLHSSVIKTNDETSKAWGTTTEFENFLAKKIQGTNLKIKKVSSTENADAITPLQIPTIDPSEPKKTIEMCTQTTKITTSNVNVQTSCPYDIPMKESVTLTAEQSAKSCEFLTSIVNTTTELGKLMTQKSEDFIKKKINTDHVTDTLKMDYCVRKSFLLFKLAKHNLTQMEEDLAKQYEQFLVENDLLKYREEPKIIIPTVQADSDSDCEIVEVPVVEEVKKTSKSSKSVPKFNPKTVFLNKELSIKIAKKPSDDKKINIKGKHTVWINDSVMVKKVKPTQSFLAQDSRNKKPPDQNVYVTAEMVSDFFEDYYRKKSLATCALFTSPEWLKVNSNYVCNYFIVKQELNPGVTNNETVAFVLNGANPSTSTTNTIHNINIVKNILEMSETSCPERLITLCTDVLRKLMPISKCNGINTMVPINDQHPDKVLQKKPRCLFELCINVFNLMMNNNTKDEKCSYESRHNLHINKYTSVKNTVLTLKILCLKKVSELMLSSAISYEFISKTQFEDYLATENRNDDNRCFIKKHNAREIKSLFSLCVDTICYNINGRDKYVKPVCQRGKDCKRQIIQPQIKHHMREVRSLFSLCVESIGYAIDGSIKYVEPFCLRSNDSKEPVMHSEIKQYRKEVKSLFSLCVESIRFVGDNSNKCVIHPKIKQHVHENNSFSCLCIKNKDSIKRNIKPLFSLCVESIQMAQKNGYQRKYIQVSPKQLQYIPKSLMQISFKNIVGLLFNHKDFMIRRSPTEITQTLYINDELAESFTINSVNTLSEEAFHNLQNTVEDPYYEDFDNEESYLNNDGFEMSYEGTEDLGVEDNNWASQVQMKELRSCVNINNTANTHPLNCDGLNSTHVVAIKSEPIEDALDNVHDSILVKIEPVNELDEMTMIPDSVITKSEVSVSSHAPDGVVNLVNRSFSVDTFEEFVRKNKIIQSLNDSTCNEVYSQSSLRVRRQFEPDYDGENDAVDGLLIPHTYTNIYNAKDCLMESSSDEVNAEKNMGKKKPVKRKVKPKKVASKTVNKDVAPPVKERSKFEASEVDELTKKMKHRIRQEEIENQSSESELEDLPLTKRRNKGIVKEINKKSTSTKDIIQCNDVDSTEQGNNSQMSSILNNVETTSSSSNSDKQNDSLKTRGKIKSHIKKISGDFEGPLELLECEPTIHENSDDDFVDSAEQLSKSIDFALSDPRNDNISKPNNYAIDDHVPKEPLTNKEGIEIVERCGWLCYPINTKDTKLYQEPSVLLDKLPESFVQTYFEYQEITEQNQVDREIDRLTNVNSLNRSSKDKGKTKPRSKVGTVDTNKPSQINATSLLESFNVSEQAHEFAPSDDEANIDAELPPPVPQRHAENTLAKSSLMDDESENEGRSVSPQASHKIKQEPAGDAPVKKRAGPKSKTRIEGPRIPDGELVLTADKMMQEELTLLHAPVTLNSIEVNNKIQTTHREPVLKTRSKHPRKVYQRVKSEEDSSSEEEKQWVNTKEKLLKKLKKAPDASASDAKRAKMVTEFIEKRGEGSESRKVTRGKYRGSRKKFLEREKQLKVLSKELYGESATDSYPRKSYVTMNYKGRRNIRKVIDKKSLERSTVKAIMEEFERKRRLNDKQNKLRAHLGCEENVNVLVINDEVCLEYDFEEDRPAVTVHAFFTKVMKAHQYEGVKFMWDACFESVDKMEAGHPGGGCILAHCMGLGKTLQVLALLHTVLTHPQVGMKRVLVCCPLSTVLNWVDEIHKWIGPVTDQLKVFELSKLKKTYERAYQLEDWYNGGGIFIIGYELFRSLSTLDPCLDDVRPTIIKKIRTALLDPGPDIVVCDEGHLLKNDCSVLAVAMSRVATRRRIVLTGTPMQNNLREYYCMVNFIKPNLLGSYSEYSNRFANPIMNGQHRDSSEEDIKLMKTRTHILHKVLEGCLQRQEASVLYPYLPKKHEYTVFIPLTKCQWDLYKHYIYTYCKHNKQSILKDFHILQKIWSHPLVLHNFHTKLSDYRKAKEEKLEDDLAAEDLTVDDIKPADTEVWWLQYLDGGNMLETLESSNKFLAVFRILNECVELGDKVLIFSTSLFCLDSLEYFLKKINKWSLGQEYYRLDGSVPPEVRHKWCREFNADNNTMTRLFLISTRAGSLGLNMTAANRVIILDTSWNPAHDIQSIFRVYRFGQKKDCFIYRLVAMGTMEQKIYERSVTKQAVACRVVDEQQIDRHYNSADLAELYRLDEAGGSVEGGVAAGVRDVALLRVARDGPVHAVHEHDSLLRASEPALPEHERAAAWQQFQNERAAEQNKPPTTKKGKMSVKGAQNTKPQTVAEINRESNTDNEAQKTDIIKCSIPIQTAKPVFFSDDSVRNDISNNVVHTLIKHSFPNMQEIKDVTHVVNVVRNIVAKVEANEDNKDMVSGIIAQSMFQNSKEPLERMADIVIKDLNLNIAVDTNQLKQLQKPSPSSQKPVTLPQKQSARLRERLLRNRNQLKEEASSEPRNDTKPKEKKNNSAPEAPSTMTDIVIELNEDVEQRSHDSSATISADEITTEPEEAARPNTKKYKKAVKNKKKLTERVVEQPTITDNSILLSDEDDVSIVPTSLPPDAPQKAQNVPIKVGKKIPNQTVQITQNQTSQKSPAPVGQSTTNQTVAGPSTYSTGKKREAREDKTVEPVPLHPSLLTNKHFITIVAHTYLEGNPLLDEDAATLAAQYSTHKAKKEIEAGRRITSGPLYDIAVKALSMETLQKLHNVAPKVPQATMVEAAASLQLEESLIDMEQSGTLTRPLPAAAPPPELPAIKKISKIREYRAAVKNSLVSETYSAVPVPPLHAIPTASSNVVPVELFKGPSMQSSGQYSRQNHEESILPDDNSSAINTNVPPPICNPLSVSAPAPKIILSHRKKPPIIVRTMLTAPKPAAQPSAVQTTANAKVSAITAVGGQIVLDPQISTICLDSDDEDTAPPSPPHRPPPGPVPVALTRVNTAQHMPVTRVVSAPAPTPAPVPPPGLTPAPAPGYFIASPSGSAVNNYINATTTPINTYAIPASNSPALVAISAPLNSFVTPVIISTANSNSTPTVTSSSHPHKTINTELPPKSLAPDEKQAKPNHFILKINNKTLRVVQSSAPPESVKTIYKLGKNDKLLPSVTNVEPPTTSENANKDRKNLVAIKPAPAVSTEASITENVRKNQSSVTTGTPSKNTNTKKSMTLKIDPKKARDTSTNQRVSTVRKSSDAVPSNSDKRDDLLDIFKDIVHIKAYDTEKTSQGVKPSNNKANNSLIKPSTNKIKSTVDLNSPGYKMKTLKEFSPLPNQTKSSVDVKQSFEFKKIAPKPTSGADLLLSFSKDTINTFSSLLAKRKASLQATSTSKTVTKDLSNPKEVLKTGVESKKAKISAKAADSFIDLTSHSTAGPSKSIDSKHNKNKITPTLADSKQNKTKPKVVNLTKNIVAIEKPVLKLAKGAIATVDITGESSKSKSNTKTKSNVQLTSSNEKKRPTTTVDIKPTKKKKVEELTLQDFDIDDLDDIIELE